MLWTKGLAMKVVTWFAAVAGCLRPALSRDEDKIMKSCYWPNEVYEPCFGGCAEVSCDNPRNHLRPCYPYCEPGCVCEDPYVRDDRTHQCVLPQDCTPTQMGIPVPTKRSGHLPPPSLSQSQSMPSNKYSSRPRSHKREESRDAPVAMEFSDVSSTREDQPQKRGGSGGGGNGGEGRGAGGGAQEVSRMGNYFNIVIAPPPIKALQPRKLLQHDLFRGNVKHM